MRKCCDNCKFKSDCYNENTVGCSKKEVKLSDKDLNILKYINLNHKEEFIKLYSNNTVSLSNDIKYFIRKIKREMNDSILFDYNDLWEFLMKDIIWNERKGLNI